MTKAVRLEFDGPIAVITNDNPEKHNAFDDDMDLQLFEILGELQGRPDVRAVIWRGEGKSFSSGRDVGAIGGGKVELTHHELMRRGHRGHPADLRPRRAGHRRHAGLVDRRLVPAGAAVRHPHRRRGRPLHAPRGRPRRDPRHRRRRPALPDVRARRRQRHGAHRPADVAPRRRSRHGVVSRVVPPDAARRHRHGDGREDRRGAGGHREDGPPGDRATWPSPRSARRWPTS